MKLLTHGKVEMALTPEHRQEESKATDKTAAPEAVTAPEKSADAKSPAPTPLASFVQNKAEGIDTSAQAEEFAKPKKASIGEKWWHGITYGGFGYLANLGVSVVLWDYFVSGGGKAVYHGLQHGAKAALKGMGANAQQAESMGGAAAKYVFSPLGGHFTMVPVKLAEDHARYITHKLNCMLDPDYKYKDLKADWNTPEADLPPLADEPTRNTWSQVAIRRGLGWASVVGSGMALRATKLEQPLEDWTIKLMNTGVDMTGSKGLKSLSQTPRAQRYVQLAALDSYLTAVTTVVTALTKQTFGTARGDHSPPDDALSIDIPGVTEVKHSLPAYNRQGIKDAAPEAQEQAEATPASLGSNEVRPLAAFAAQREKNSSFVDAHNARQQAAEKDVGSHLSA